jgi:hypothetical protein
LVPAVAAITDGLDTMGLLEAPAVVAVDLDIKIIYQ